MSVASSRAVRSFHFRFHARHCVDFLPLFAVFVFKFVSNLSSALPRRADDVIMNVEWSQGIVSPCFVAEGNIFHAIQAGFSRRIRPVVGYVELLLRHGISYFSGPSFGPSFHDSTLFLVLLSPTWCRHAVTAHAIFVPKKRGRTVTLGTFSGLKICRKHIHWVTFAPSSWARKWPWKAARHFRQGKILSLSGESLVKVESCFAGLMKLKSNFNREFLYFYQFLQET